MRLLFIPGFGEDETIFDNLHPLLPGDKRFLSFWRQLPNESRPELNATRFAQTLVQQYALSAKDVVIGHSTGGWVALSIKQQVHCPVVQLSSWTDPKKVEGPMAGRRLVYFLARSGLVFNKPVRQWLLRTNYRDKLSAPVFTKVFTNLVNGNKENVVNQLRLILAPLEEKITVRPDLVLHAKADPIVRFPDGPATEIPGDHFSLYTHAETVAKFILQFLSSLP